jgi:hypothetical protein
VLDCFRNLVAKYLLHTFEVSVNVILEPYILFFNRFCKQSDVM